jgi:DnaJ-class molecular chaperone
MEPTKRGDFVVTLFLQGPSQLTDEQKKLLEQKLPGDSNVSE